MSIILEFMMGSEGERSVGIFSHEEKVTVIFHDRDDNPDIEDDQKEIKKLLAELADGWCVTMKEYDDDMFKAWWDEIHTAKTCGTKYILRKRDDGTWGQ